MPRPDASPEILAQVAYAAYGERTGFKNYQDRPMPSWDQLGETIQEAWIAAALAVQNRVNEPA